MRSITCSFVEFLFLLFLFFLCLTQDLFFLLYLCLSLSLTDIKTLPCGGRTHLHLSLFSPTYLKFSLFNYHDRHPDRPTIQILEAAYMYISLPHSSRHGTDALAIQSRVLSFLFHSRVCLVSTPSRGTRVRVDLLSTAFLLHSFSLHYLISSSFSLDNPLQSRSLYLSYTHLALAHVHPGLYPGDWMG